MKEANKRSKIRNFWHKFLRMIIYIWKQFDDQYFSGFAAQIAYYFFMASVPTLVVLSEVLGFFDVSLGFVKAWLQMHMESKMSELLTNILNASSVGVGNVLLIILALWAASALEFSLARLNSYILTDGVYKFRFWTERIAAIPTALLTILTAAATIVIVIYSNVVFVGFSNKYQYAPMKYLLALRWPLIFGAFFIVVLVNYYVIQCIKVPFASVLPGSVVSSLGILLITSVYSFYINRALNRNILYGSLSNIVGIMLWFYLIAWVLCIGMMFNKAWDIVMERNRLSDDKVLQLVAEKIEKDGEQAVAIPDKIIEKIENRLDRDE